MKGFVLAAGFGTRMGELTRNLPKPMLPFQGVPLIAHSLFTLHQLGCRSVVINLHYLGDRIRNFLADFWKMEIRFSEESEILGTAGGVRLALERQLVKENEPLLLINPDTLFLQPEKLVNPSTLLSQNHYRTALTLAPRKAGKIETGFSYTNQSPSLAFHEKDEGGGDRFYTGLAAIYPETLLHIAPGEFADLRDPWRELAGRGLLAGIDLKSDMLDLGTVESYREACEAFPESASDSLLSFLES